jgi:hypothetical protein
MDVVADSSAKDWISIAYGNDRFVAISSTGDIGYSFDGSSWLPATMPSQDGSTAHNWKKIRYAQGVFFAVGDTGNRIVGGDPSFEVTNFAATSFDGIVWTPRELAEEQIFDLFALWQDMVFDGEIKYPTVFQVRDKNHEIDLLKKASDTNPADPRVKAAIDMKILEMLDLDEEEMSMINATPNQTQIQEQLMTGVSNEEIQQNIPGTTEQDIVAAASAAALEN